MYALHRIIIMTEQNLSFSQRYGYTKVNNTIQVESLNANLRTDLWNFLYDHYFKSFLINYSESTLLRTVYTDFLHQRVDCIPMNLCKRKQEFEKIFYGSIWYYVYDFLEFLYDYFYKHPYVTQLKNFLDAINTILEKNNAGYRFIAGRIAPITDTNEINTIQSAIDNAPYTEIQTHLSTALQFLSDKTAPDYRNSIKESISAVESFCRKITRESTLDNALNKMTSKGLEIPQTLLQGLKKLYYFTNGRDGIRHALMDESHVGYAEAYFMLIACSSFINYLKIKQSKIK